MSMKDKTTREQKIAKWYGANLPARMTRPSMTVEKAAYGGDAHSVKASFLSTI